jgi:hypothetical protein
MNYSQTQLDELDRLTERWVADHLQRGKTSKKDKELVTLEFKACCPFSPASTMTFSTFALASRNAAAPLAAISSFGTSGACALPEEPYALENDGCVDRSVLVILIGPFVVEMKVVDNFCGRDAGS